jgi:hypothetical protein
MAVPISSTNPVMGTDEVVLKIYRRRLSIADRKYEKGKSERESFVGRYRNKANSDQITEDGHLVSVVSGIGLVDTMYASMTAVDIEFLCSVIGNGTRLQATAATAALNQAWRDTKGQKRAKDAVKDALLVDVGWVKVYYDYQEAQGIEDVPEEALRAQISRIAEERGISPEDVPEAELDVVRDVDIVIRDRVCVEYVPWQMIRYDPSAKRVEDIRWVCQYTSVPLYEAQNHPVWSEFVTEKYGDRKGRDLLESISSDSAIETFGDSDPGMYPEIERDEYADDERVTLCEMWDFETGLVTIFPKGRGDVILHQRINPLMLNADLEDRSPFKPLLVRKDSSQFEGIGDMRMISPALTELDTYRTMLSQYIERSIPKINGPEEGLTEKGKNALKSQVMGELVGTQGVDGSAYSVLQPPPLPSEAFEMQDRIQVEMKEGTGVSEPMRGVFTTKRTTATEVQTVTDRGDMRQSERRSALEDWYISIARTMLQLMQVNYDQDRMLRYTDDAGNEFEWAWNNQDIAVDADILVSLTPKNNMTRDQRVQQFLLLMNLALPLPEADRAEFVRQAAVEMGYRADEINPLIKSGEEVDAEKQKAEADALAVRPQPFANSAPGLNIG